VTREDLLDLARRHGGVDLLAALPGSKDEAFKYTPFHHLLGEGPARLAGWRVVSGELAPAEPAARPTDTWSALGREAHRAPSEGSASVVHELAGEGVGGVTLLADAAGDLTLEERFVGSGDLQLPTAVLRVAPGASLTHVRVVDTAPGVRHAGRVQVEVAEGGSYRLVSLLAGGAVSRVDVDVRLVGPRATAELHGLVVLGGAQHADHHVTLRHDAPSCASRQAFRALVGGRARSVFTGRVVVRRGADGTDAAQEHRALLLSDQAVVNARPQLEIHTDDVKASHGAAVGALDEEALFFLRQRGLDEAQARRLLVGAFADAVLAAAPAELRPALEQDLARWTARP
jgi:Fe-S cluster assembly protein SufD